MPEMTFEELEEEYWFLARASLDYSENSFAFQEACYYERKIMEIDPDYFNLKTEAMT